MALTDQSSLDTALARILDQPAPTTTRLNPVSTDVSVGMANPYVNEPAPVFSAPQTTVAQAAPIAASIAAPAMATPTIDTAAAAAARSALQAGRVASTAPVESQMISRTGLADLQRQDQAAYNRALQTQGANVSGFNPTNWATPAGSGGMVANPYFTAPAAAPAPDRRALRQDLFNAYGVSNRPELRALRQSNPGLFRG